MAPRRIDLRISAPLCNPELRTASSHGPNPYPPLSPIQTSQRLTHASYPPMHSSLPFDGTERTSYHNRFASHNPQSSTTIAIGQNSTMHRRRASTLKSIMRRLFGRKHKSELVAPDSGFHEKTRMTTPSQASTGLRGPNTPFITVADAVNPSSKSSSSHGQNSFLPSPAEPTFVTIPIPQEHDEDEDEDDDPKPEAPRRHHRRRATLPSLVLSTEEGRELASRIAQEGSRNESVSSSPTRKTIDRLPRPTEKQLKRRSRSAYALRESAKAHRMSPIQWRRRSDEMKLWRVSVERKTEAESIQERPETRSTIGDFINGEEEKDLSEIHLEHFAPSNELGQLDFGNLVSNMQEDTEASLTQRVCTLEVKLMDLEFAIAKMQGSDVSPIQPFQPMTPTRPTNNNLDSGPSSAASASGFLRASTSHGAAPPRSSPANTTRPTSTATVRPHTAIAHSSPPLTPSSTSPGISVEQYSALTTLVRREQVARKNLESQVSQLQHELQALRDLSRPGRTNDKSLRASSADSSSTQSRHRPRHDRLDSGMWRQMSQSSGGKPEHGSLDSHPVRSDSPPHRKSAFDRMLGRS